MASHKYVYFFGAGKAEGKGHMRELLGGKGANLAEMAGHPNLRLPVPPGFTITTEVCTYYYDNKRKYPKELKAQVEAALKKTDRAMKKKFGDPKNPLLFSVRSGARSSMPGMMETVLNIGLTTKTIPGLIEQTGGNERFVYDAYRRLITMYSDVVMEKAAGKEPGEGEGIRHQLEHMFEAKKNELGVTEDTDVGAEDLKELCAAMKKKVKEVLGKPFPDKAEDQIWGGISSVFASWNGKRAVAYRNIEGIPHEWGTAVNVQAMVFGNMGDDCATGVAFTRDPGTGQNIFYGEYLVNAQGEDVVAGIRTPGPINVDSTVESNREMVTLAKYMPKAYKELDSIQKRLEKHYHDMQDIEFTIEKGRLFMLQCRVGKRNGPAAVRMAVEMHKERLISAEEAITRVTADQLDELLHPILDPAGEKVATQVAKGLPAGPGGAVGKIAFTSDEAVERAAKGETVILVRGETNPEDVEGMRASIAVLTSRGGMTSHAALVARGWGKCCIVGCADLDIDTKKKTIRVDGYTFTTTDTLSLNGSKGNVYAGALPMVEAGGDETFDHFLKLCDKIRRLDVRTNADTPEDSAKARSFGAQGIGLFRTEHMFYGEHSEAPLKRMRQMILADSDKKRQKAIDQLFPFIKKDIKATLEAMAGLPVTIRLLDPPLHEFVPHEEKKLADLALELGLNFDTVRKRAEALHETNPMMGHRGVRLGITFPEVTAMQARAIFEAAGELQKDGVKVFPEIMVPVVAAQKEMATQFEVIEGVYKQVIKELGIRKIKHLTGTMIEIPRAALTADKLAESAQFFSFGTNDLTQMGFGFSRDDIGGFLGDYLEQGILDDDPFQTIDPEGISELVKIGIERGRSTKPNLKIGICGEHGGDPRSVRFCHSVGMDYVSCSPYRVPIARLAAAQAVVEQEGAPQKKTAKKKTAKKKTAKKKAAKKKTAKKGAKKTSAKKAEKAAKKSASKKASSKKVSPRSASKAKRTSQKRGSAKKSSSRSRSRR